MSETNIKMVDGVYVITGITKTKQLVEFYNEVVRNNYEKYVGITTEGVKYAYDSFKGTAVRLPKEQEYAVNPNYRPIEIEKPVEVEEKQEVVEEIKPEPVVEQKVVEPEETAPVENTQTVIQKVEEVPAPTPEVDYESLYKEKCEEMAHMVEELEIAEERANFAEKENTQLMELKVINEGRIEELKSELSKKVAEISCLTTDINCLKEDLEKGTHYTELDTDTLINHLKNKGYTVSITR